MYSARFEQYSGSWNTSAPDLDLPVCPSYTGTYEVSPEITRRCMWSSFVSSPSPPADGEPAESARPPNGKSPQARFQAHKHGIHQAVLEFTLEGTRPDGDSGLR